MVSVLGALRKPFRLGAALLLTFTLAACQAGGGLGGSGARLGNDTIQVAMLLPVGSAQGGDAIVARSLENAARLAVADLQGRVEITVYDTAGQPAQAASVAQSAVSAGADVIVGPLRSDAAAAVGVAVANSGISVLSFSNNTEIAGGNVFVLGHTFANTADRIIGYGARQGRTQIVVGHADTLAGQVARDAVLRAAAVSGATVVATIPYEFSQNGVVNAVPQVVDAVRANGASALMLTSDSAGALPFFAQLLPENGLDVGTVQLMGLTRWDRPPATREFAGLQGSWFALPDPAAAASFDRRYEATYGAPPHILAAIGYDAVLAAGRTAAETGRLGPADFASVSGFDGANGVFRLRGDGTNQRAMAIAQILDNQVDVIDPAPRSFGGFGF